MLSFFLIFYYPIFCFAALLIKISALRSFSLDKLHYRRESESGMSALAYFLSKDSVDHFNTLIKPLVFLSMFYSFSNPRSTFLENYVVLLCLVYCVTGIAYVFAIFLQQSQAQLVCHSQNTSTSFCFFFFWLFSNAEDTIFLPFLNTVVCASSCCSHPHCKST